MKTHVTPSNQKGNSPALDTAMFDRVLKRIEQGKSTVHDARFIRYFVTSIQKQGVISGNHS